MIIINAKLKVSEKHREAYLDLMTNLVKHAREEEGNTFYSHYEDVAERNTFVVVENYKDQDAVGSTQSFRSFQSF